MLLPSQLDWLYFGCDRLCAYFEAIDLQVDERLVIFEFLNVSLDLLDLL